MSSVDGLLIDFATGRGSAFLLRLSAAALTIAVSIVAARVSSRLVRGALERVEASAFATFIPAFVRSTIVAVGVIGALEQLGVDVGTLLAGAGVLGLAVGFGSQAIVKDVVSGIFFVTDGALRPGDHVKIGECSGIVERIGLRLTEIRGERGELFYLPNGAIGTIANHSRTWSRITVDLPVPHSVNLAETLADLQRIADDFARDHAGVVLEPPEAHGLVALEPDKAIVRIVAKVKANARESSGMELRRRIREEFLRPR
jgi:small-conductance mechanosensitive channel